MAGEATEKGQSVLPTVGKGELIQIPKPEELASAFTVLRTLEPATDFWAKGENRDKPAAESVKGVLTTVTMVSEERMDPPTKIVAGVIKKYGEPLTDVLLKTLGLDKPIPVTNPDGTPGFRNATGNDVQQGISAKFDYRYQGQIVPKIDEAIKNVFGQKK